MQRKQGNVQKNVPKNPKEKVVNKLPEDMENEIKDAFNYYINKEKEKSKDVKNQQNTFSSFDEINKSQLKSILGNFGFAHMNVKDIDNEIKNNYQTQPSKSTFTYDEVIQLITKKWFDGGRDAEATEIFKLFDRKNKHAVGVSDIKQLFGQYLDIVISEADIQEFVQEADQDQDTVLNKVEFCTKLGYM